MFKRLTSLLLLVYLYLPLDTSSTIDFDGKAIVVSYNVTFKEDKSNPIKSKTLVKLFIFDSKSIFLDNNSLLRKNLETSNKSRDEKIEEMGKIGSIKFKDIILKDYSRNNLTVIAENLHKQFIAYETPIMSTEFWTIYTEQDSTIVGLKAYKAECRYGGRHWKAWFSPEIAVSDGPYKFSGLPGLILKLSSNDDEYSFEISALEKSQILDTNIIIPPYKVLAKSKFDELQKVLLDDPFAQIKSNGGTIVGPISVNGKQMTVEEFAMFLKKEKENQNNIEKN
jgi:GLPGLI family protein